MDSDPTEYAEVSLPHPLENQLILEHILDYLQPTLNIKDWKLIRAVCKTWYSQTLYKWRTSVYLNLNPLNSNQPAEKKAVTSTEYLALLQDQTINGFAQYSDKPFQKFKLENLEVDLVNLESSFWSVVGQQIKYLSLYKVNFNTERLLVKDVMIFLVNNLPNLEHLKMDCVFIDAVRMDHPPRRMPVVHTNVKSLSLSNCYAIAFPNFPNLEEVTLERIGYYEVVHFVYPNADSATDTISETSVITNPSIKRLSFLNCKFNLLRRMPVNFENVRFTKLEYLFVSREFLRYCDDDFKFLYIFVKNHRNTLQTLEFFGSLTKMPVVTNFIPAPMPELTVIRAWGNVFSDLTFLKYTPNLQVLHIDMYGFEKKERMKKETTNSPNAAHRFIIKFDIVEMSIKCGRLDGVQLEYLHHFQINCELNQSCWQMLAEWFPNLKTLRGVFNSEQFTTVCEEWSKLERLDCLFGSTILNKNIIEDLVELEGLTTFMLETECDTSQLSDEAIFEGFVRLPKLTNVSICVSPEFSEEAEIRLRQHVANVQLYRNYSANPLHKNWQCCRDKEFKNLAFAFEIEENLKKVMQSCSTATPSFGRPVRPDFNMTNWF